MNAKEARTRAVALDPRINVVERVRLAGTQSYVHILGRAYTTPKGGTFSVEILAAALSWDDAVIALMQRVEIAKANARKV